MPKKENRLTVFLFGAPRVTLGNSPIETARRKTLALLVYLAFDSKPHTRESLAAIFWAEQSQERAFANLRHALWEINESLGEGWIESDRDEIRLAGDIDLDLTRFHALLAASNSATVDSASRILSLAQAAALYTDNFLAGFTLKDAPAFDDWAFFHAESLRRELTSALETLTNGYCDSNRAAEAIPFARRWLALDALNESAHRQLMIAYELAGEHASALRQYQQCEATLQKELGVKPEAETKTLHEKIRAGGLQKKPSARNNLPAAVTSFIGRENEAERVRSELALNRLVTLTGSGGVGKTRLAIESARGALSQFPQGVWLVELAPLASADLIPQAMGDALGVDHKDADALVEFLRERAALILLDNCEHIIAGAAKFAAHLLAGCPNLRLLATSRESLEIDGEFALRVPSLETSDAARLFAERARLVQPSFALDGSNASVIADICTRLDGIPLAIELAASRVKMLSLEQISARLDNAIALLTGGSRAALPRQQTLRAAIDWSYNLLPESEQALFRKLSIFTGGWTLDAAESVCCEDGSSVLDSLTQLANKSLIHVDVVRIGNPQSAGYHPAPRYFMLETIRQYAREKLKETGEEVNAQETHARWCVELAERAEPNLRKHGQVEWLDRLEAEHDNFRAALGWSLKNHKAETALRLAGALSEFWKMRAYAGEGLQWLESAIKESEAESIPAKYRAKVHLGIAVLILETPKFENDSQLVRNHASEAIRIYEEIGDTPEMIHAVYVSSGAPWVEGDFVKAREVFEHGYQLATRAEDAWGMGSCLHCLGHLAQIDGNPKQARVHFEQSIVILREHGDLWNLAHPLMDIAICYWNEGDTKKSLATHEASIETFRAVGDTNNVAWQQRLLGLRAMRMGKFDLAKDFFERALAITLEHGFATDNAAAYNHLGVTATLQGDFATARVHLETALRIQRAATGQINLARVLRDFGLLHYYDSQPNEARAALNESLTIFEQIPNAEKTDHALACLTRGDLARLDGDLDSARGFYLKSLTLTEALPLLPYPVEGFAKLNILHAQAERAARLFGAAHGLREKMEIPIPPVECADYEKHLALTKRALGKKEFASAWREGEKMSVGEVRELAMEGS
ncbi:MAG: tetratricopeptide repeat protein [Chloroflexi bacterium]|nr:tetratricopeptide repeat protein [Chloroflexota bacterium]